MAVFNTLGEIRRLVTGPNLAPGHRSAVTIAISAQKGGVGKTTTAVHLASGLAMYQGLKVLLIDMDAQGHVDTSILSHISNDNRDTMGHLLLQKRRELHEIATATRIKGLWRVPSDKALNHTEAQMASRIGRELLLKRALRLTRTHYDLIIIDCPPNMGSLTINALVAADLVLTPCDLSLLSLDGVENLLDAVESIRDTLNPELKILGLLRTRVDRRNQKVNAAIEETLKHRYGGLVLETDIGVSTAIAKAQLSGQTVFSFDEKCRAAIHYKALAAEVVARIRREGKMLLPC